MTSLFGSPPSWALFEVSSVPDSGGAIATGNKDHEPTIEVSTPQGRVTLVVLGGEHDLTSAAELAETLDESLTICSHLIVDLSATEFIDSSTIHTLLTAKKAADKAGRSFNLVLGTTPIVERALEITGVLPALNRVHSVDEALQDV